MKRHIIPAAILATLLMTSGAHAVAVVTWVGGSSNEWDLGDWFASDTSITGPASTTIGRHNGWRQGDLGRNDIIMLIDNGDDVHNDVEFLGDFSIEGDGAGLLLISNGSTLELESNATSDGKWTEIDGKGITVTGAGSEFRRTATNPANGGGAFVWGSWRNDPGEKMDLQVLDGGLVDNSGQMWFGAWDDSEPDLDITWTIGEKATINNHDYLQGGVSYDQPGPDPDAAINFIYNYDPITGLAATNDYDIDMTGHGGKLQVGTGQIKTQVKSGLSDTDWATTIKTYEDLYADGLLLSSGSNAGAFDDSFIVSGSTGDAVYSVTNISGAVAGGSHPGDISGDCAVNAVDAGTMFANWGTGTTVAQGDINAGGGGDDLINAADAGVMFAAWTGDPGPAFPGTAAATYDPTTGEIIVSIDGVNNWFIESASNSLNGDAPTLGLIPGALPSDGDGIIGETAFAVATAASHSLGNVAAPGLPYDDLKIFWNAGLGAPLQWSYFIVPEPATLTLAAFGLCGVLATRRRVPKTPIPPQMD